MRAYYCVSSVATTTLTTTTPATASTTRSDVYIQTDRRIHYIAYNLRQSHRQTNKNITLHEKDKQTDRHTDTRTNTHAHTDTQRDTHQHTGSIIHPTISNRAERLLSFCSPSLYFALLNALQPRHLSLSSHPI